MTNFEKVNPKQSFPKMEEEIIKFWKENDIFKKSIENRENSEEFNFYDGPPFATGTPHYGHILAGAIKDVIPRYQTMKGKKVERKFGWDTHGLPIENIVEKKLNISGKEDIEQKIGVHKFNETCKENVFGYVEEWREVVERMGRWVDMDNDYKTMDTSFMESVWWVYKTIYNKGLIYEGNRIVPYCPRCTTPLSNFEVNQGYKDKQSKTVTVKFKIDNGNKYILAWTTTPWTLYANLALAVGENIMYSEILDKESSETYILASDLVKNYYKNEDDYTIVREYKGSCLVGTKYEPLFDDFKIQLDEMGADLGTGIKLGKNSYSVVLGHHVTTESGTGIVHIAPAYGEDDNIIGKEQDLGFVAHVNDSGKIYNLIDENKNGQFIFDFNENVISELKDKKVNIHIGTINHSYPHCWRCDTPLVYRAISAWYVDVTAIKEKMIANNQKINWVPDDIKNGRMGKWLEGARDWNISRNRYWGSAIPIWQSPDKKEEVCIGSIEELYKLNKDFGQITKVIFVRHGRTDYNEKDLMDYKNEAQLTEIGKKQAEEITKIFENENIDAIYSSPLDRCVNTISPLAKSKNLEIEKIDNFIEINSPDLQGKKAQCKSYTWDNGFGGGEKICEVYERVEKSLKEIIEKNKGKTIVICSHGDPTFLGRMSLDDSIDYSQKYTSGKYLKNNPKKALISEIYGVEYVYTNTGKAIDLHKHFVDEILVKNPKTGNSLKRIPEVLDCWFESGSMPYASKHYMGEKGGNKIKNLVFDFGKVLLASESLEKNIKILDPDFDYQKFEQQYNKEIKQAHFENTDILYDKILEFSNKTFTKKDLLEKASKNVNTDLLEQLPELAKKYNIYIFSNCTPKFIDTFLKVHNIEHLITKIIQSCDENTEKPNKDFYEILFNKCNILPKESIFFDDKLENIEMGEKLGMKGIHFKDLSININKIINDNFNNFKFPADFIAEGLDQTRGWFYTLLILGTALFENTPFLNCIVNGIILAEDGKKMSKSLQNYPAPEHIFNDYGADAMRFYLLNSPVVEAEDFRFSEAGVEEVVKKVILPLWNTYYFFTTYANIDGFTPLGKEKIEDFSKQNINHSKSLYKEGEGKRSNKLDTWLISELNELTREVGSGFDNYKLRNAAMPIVKFMDNLTNWYIRRSRKRFWKSENDGDKLEAYETLYFTLVELCKIIAPFMPFISEHIFKNLTGKDSVHLEDFPIYNENLIDEKLNADMDKIQKIITLGLAFRANEKIRVRQPLKSLTITEDFEEYYKDILKEELNVKEVLVVAGETLAKKVCKPNGRAIGPKFGKNVKFIMSEAKAGNFEELENGNIKVGEFELEVGDFELVFETGENTGKIEAGFGMVITMDENITPELKKEGFARDIVRHIQEARKEALYNVEDRIKISIKAKDKSSNLIEEIISDFKNYIEGETLSSIKESLENLNFRKEIEIEGEKIEIYLKK